LDLIKAKDDALGYLDTSRDEVMKWFRQDFEVREKSDKSPVTIADQNAEILLREQIHRDYPGHGIIGEEFGTENGDAEWVWTIDPIDGTRSFIRGLPLFASLIALLHKGEPVMGIIALPALDETAWGARGHGTWCNGNRLCVSPQKKLRQATVATADIYCFEQTRCKKLFHRLQRESALTRTYPDAFGHLMAIRGAVDVMVDPLAFIWDYAPCKILALEAGGQFANFTGNRADIRQGTAIVGNAHLVKSVRALVRQELKR